MSTNDSNTSLVVGSAVAQEAPELPQGSKIDRYLVLEALGRGGMGVVYKAYDPKLNRGVALKLIRARQDRRGNASVGSARLLREAQALAQLTHPNVVAVHDVGIIEGQVFVAMELVGGRTLNAWRSETKPTTKEVLEVMRAAGWGLAAAHKAGLIHRDFKPANVIVGDDGRVRVIDFGLACAGTTQPSATVAPQRDLEDIEATETLVRDRHELPVDDSRETSMSSSSRDFLATPLTHIGSIVGTPMYMAPEQHLGARVDARADQFSFCAVLYEVLYGRRPFSGKSRKGLVNEILDGRVQPRPTHTDVPKWLHGIVVRGLSKTPDERYPSMEELLEQLRQDPDEVRRRQRAASKRKLFVMGSVVLAVVVPLGAWYGLRVRTARMCQATKGELGGVWDSGTKDAIRMAFLDTNKSYAADTWQRVSSAFDNYTAEWTQMRAEACYARWLSGTQSEEVFDLRMSCLKKRIGELRALAKVFANADAGVVQKAVQASSSLTGIGICADEEALRAPYPQPKTAEAKAKVAAIRGKLAEVEAFSNTGMFREALELARKLKEEANAVAYRPVQAEVLYQLGVLIYRNGESNTAETTLYEAARAAGKSRDRQLSARAMSALLFVVGYAQGRPEDGLLIGRDAEIVVELGGGDDVLRYQILNNMGIVLESKGESDKALTYLRKALAIREKALGPEHPGLAIALNNMGIVLESKGEYDKALEYHREALAIAEKALGPEHPRVAHPLNSLGDVLSRKGEDDKAMEHYRRALAIWEKGLGPEHPRVAGALSDIGAVFRTQGQYDKALEYYRKALAIREKVLGPEHPEVAVVLNGIGLVFSSQGNYDKALASYRKALAIDEKALGPEHPDVAESLSGIGNVFVDQGRPQQALGPFARAAAICEKMTCQPEPHGRGLFALARALVATDGDNKRAIRLATEARGVFGKVPYLKKELEEVNAWLKERGVE